jgi:pantoate--beta-alanine ligase
MLTRITEPETLRRWGERVRASGLSLGLVPTMGALHEGHRSLLRRARSECERVAVSIFVNPAQFGPHEDFERYPRRLDDDLDICAEEGTDAVYTPAVEAVYPRGFATRVRVEGRLGSSLEGEHRPGHFEGVATMVAKLLVAVHPDRAYFGHKDAQQCAVVRRLAADLEVGTEIIVSETVRDPDGLALSSRNRYLSPAERRQALAIPAALEAVQGAHRRGEVATAALLRIAAQSLARSPDLAVDYVAAVDPETFEPVAAVNDRCEILVAARIAGTRLIDSLRLGADAGLVVGDRENLGPRP